MLLAALLALVQTLASPGQLTDQQVRTDGMAFTGTRVHLSQVRDGRTKEIVDGVATICLVEFIGVLWSQSVPQGSDVTIRTKTCATPLGLALALQNPEWLDWWNKQP